MKQHVTLKDIAERLNLSISTVSRALKDYPDIRKETKQAVLAMVDEMDYEPDMLAASLRRKKTNIIGLIIPEIVHFFFSNVLKGIMNYCEGHGYRLLITLSENRTKTEEKQVKLLYGTKVDGVLVSLANETTDTSHFQLLLDHEIPVVMFDKIDRDYPSSKVVVDDTLGGYRATEHLISCGCKRIAHISGPETPQNARDRLAGYQQALEKNGLDFDASLLKFCDEVTLEEGHAFARELLESASPPDGIFTCTDQVAAGVLMAANELGVKVPDQLKVIGFSDSQIARITTPQISSIHQPGYKMGEVAARLLIEQIEAEDDKEVETIVLDTETVVRGSSLANP